MLYNPPKVWPWSRKPLVSFPVSPLQVIYLWVKTTTMRHDHATHLRKQPSNPCPPFKYPNRSVSSAPALPHLVTPNGTQGEHASLPLICDGNPGKIHLQLHTLPLLSLLTQQFLFLPEGCQELHLPSSEDPPSMPPFSFPPLHMRSSAGSSPSSSPAALTSLILPPPGPSSLPGSCSALPPLPPPWRAASRPQLLTPHLLPLPLPS